MDIHTERTTDGIRIEGPNAHVSVFNAEFNNNVTSGVHLLSDATGIVNIANVTGSATNHIVDDVLSRSIPTNISLYNRSGAGSIVNALEVTNSQTTYTQSGEVVFTLRSMETTGSASRIDLDLKDGNNDGWRMRFAADGSNDPLDFSPITADAVGAVLLSLDDTGVLSFGGDTNISRRSAGILSVPNSPDTNFEKVGASATSDAYTAFVTGDSQFRFIIESNGDILLGPGNAIQDVRILRLGTNILGLATGDSFAPQTTGQDIGSTSARWDAFLEVPTFYSGTSFQGVLDHSNTAARTWTLPDAAGNIPALPNAATTETGTGAIVRQSSPTLAGTPVMGDGAGNDKLEFAEEATNPTCAAGQYFVWANSTDLKLKKCQNGSISDLDTGGGGGHTITVNGSALASATAADFDDATPAAPANGFNVKWQKDALDPTNISAYLPYSQPLTESGGNLTVTTSPAAAATVVGTGRTLTGGAGIAALGDLSADRTIATASQESGFLADGGAGSLACGAGTAGQVQVMDNGDLEFCDGAATPALQKALAENDQNPGTDITADLEEETHASEHQHGGADEVATATPGANAIPKAGAGSTLAAGWIQEVIALADLTGVTATSGSGTTAVLNTSPTLAGTPLIGDGAGNDKLEFAEEATNPTCAAGQYFVWANSTDLKLKKCQNGTISDLDTTGGAGGGYDTAKGDTGTASRTGTEALQIAGTSGEIDTNAADGSPDDTVTISIPSTISNAKTVSALWTFDRGTTPDQAVLIAIPQPGVAGQRDSHFFDLTGTSFDTAGHDADWRQFVDVTSNGAASQLTWQSRIDAAGFATRLALTDGGTLLFGSAGDTNLYRSAANSLKTDDNFELVGFLQANDGALLQDDPAIASTVAADTFINATASFADMANLQAAINQIQTGVNITNWFGVRVHQPVLNGTATLTNAYGIKVENVTVGGTLNYAILTGTGKVQFGDIVEGAQNLTFKSGTSFLGTLDHAITAARTWTLPDATTSLAHAPAALTSGQLVQGNGGAEVQASGFTAQAAGSAGTNVTNAGTATSLARSDHEHRVPWQVGAHYEATPAVAESTVPLPMNEACGGSIDATAVHITALTKGSGTMSFNVVRYNSAGTSQGNLFASNQSYSNTGNNRQSFTPDQNNTNIGSTDYFRFNFVTVNGQDDLTVAVSGKCKNVN